MNLDVERGILACILQNYEIDKIFSKLTVEHFSKAEHAFVFSEAKNLYEKGKSCDLISLSAVVSDKIEDIDIDLEKINTIEISEIDSWLSILNERFLKRKLGELPARFLKNLTDTDPVNVIEAIHFYLDKIQEKSNGEDDYVILPEDIYERRKKGILERRDLSKIVPIGYNSLDEVIVKGFSPGISIIAGRPATGKSLCRTNITRNLCENGYGVVTFCLEQDFQTEMDRLESIVSGIPLHDLVRIYQWDENDHKFILRDKIAKDISKKWNLSFVDRRTMSLADVVRMVRQIKQKMDVQVVFLDLFDRLTDINAPDNKAERIAQKLSELSHWASLLNVHFCLIVQLRRSVETRRDSVPLLSDLKSSGAYEEIAEFILFVKKMDIEKNIIEVTIGKQKQGKSGISLFFEMNQETLSLVEREDLNAIQGGLT